MYPSLYQINTPPLAQRAGRRLGRAIDLATVPESELDAIAQKGFDWVWLLGVWETGDAGRQSFQNPGILVERLSVRRCRIFGSADVATPFAIQGVIRFIANSAAHRPSRAHPPAVQESRHSSPA